MSVMPGGHKRARPLKAMQMDGIFYKEILISQR